VSADRLFAGAACDPARWNVLDQCKPAFLPADVQHVDSATSANEKSNSC